MKVFTTVKYSIWQWALTKELTTFVAQSKGKKNHWEKNQKKKTKIKNPPKSSLLAILYLRPHSVYSPHQIQFPLVCASHASVLFSLQSRPTHSCLSLHETPHPPVVSQISIDARLLLPSLSTSQSYKRRQRKNRINGRPTRLLQR